jgi:hypothetical protein
MADLGKRRYWELIAAGYRDEGLAVPKDVQSEIDAAYEEGDVEASAAVEDFWVSDLFGCRPTMWRNKVVADAAAYRGEVWEHSYSFSYRKTEPTIDPTVPGIAAYKKVDLDEVIFDLWEYDRVWRAKRSGNKKKTWIAWMEGYPLRVGFHADVYKQYLNDTLVWNPCMGIGTGAQVHLRPDQVPGDCLARITDNVVPVLGGKLHWPVDPLRAGTRTVYGYWQ